MRHNTKLNIQEIHILLGKHFTLFVCKYIIFIRLIIINILSFKKEKITFEIKDYFMYIYIVFERNFNYTYQLVRMNYELHIQCVP
jgi:hypothetical protein